MVREEIHLRRDVRKSSKVKNSSEGCGLLYFPPIIQHEIRLAMNSCRYKLHVECRGKDFKAFQTSRE
ncbi:1943_t:CDS:2 [Acaulospora morrowiae]|uniref:1943_t:CDS:1 n=1 Tax=Acaulospora morrowiae TaxID=94023 RepID=A0A9N9AJ06_9GLOM|nr:1943_t:CDS:2 [Acaulospora morrowiae]